MIYVVLFFLGLCFGSFVNAAVWRMYEQSRTRKSKKELSIVHGRSMCPHCRHELSAIDLIPVLSWLLLRGKCRYCKGAISVQYPLVELATAALFVISYVFWPAPIAGVELLYFVAWLILLVGFVFLTVYDMRWFLLPDKVIYPLVMVGLVLVTVRIIESTGSPFSVVFQHLGAVAVASGLFWILYQMSSGRWIGGGDVKLGVVLGLALGSPWSALIMLFIASSLGVIFALPGLVVKRIQFGSRVPFGPFLISATILMYLFGSDVITWYQQQFLFL